MRAACILLTLCCVSGFGQSPLSIGGALSQGIWPATPAPLPTPPNTAYRYADLQIEPTNCASYINNAATTQSANSANGCWNVDSIDATGAAGAGIQTLTSIRFGVASPSISGAAMSFDVANMPPVVTTGTGSSGVNTIVVGAITNLNNKQGEVVTGTGIGSGAQICYAVTGACAAAWNGTSTTIPLTVVNSAAVSGNVTFTTNFVSNALAYQHVITGANTGITNMLDDFYYWIPSTTNTLTAFEVDPDIFTGNYQVMASFQCDVYSGSAAPGQWRFWDSGTQSWVLQSGFTYSCTAAQAQNQWHHFQAYSTYNTSVTPPTYAYQTLIVDGVTIFQNINFGHSGSVTGYNLTANQINVQHQIDGLGTTPRSLPGNKIYYDRYNLTVW